MNIQIIKQQIAAKTGANLATLMMTQQLDKDTKQPTEWCSHWDNEKRVRVSMHMDLFNDIKANPTQDGLAIKEQVVLASGDRAAYTRYVVIKPANVLGTF